MTLSARRVQRLVVGAKENTKFIHDGDDVLVDDNSGTQSKYLNGEEIDNKMVDQSPQAPKVRTNLARANGPGIGT